MRRQHNEAAIRTMINNLTVKSRLAVVIGLLSPLLVAIGCAGLSGVAGTNEGLRAVYSHLQKTALRVGMPEY